MGATDSVPVAFAGMARSYGETDRWQDKADRKPALQ